MPQGGTGRITERLSSAKPLPSSSARIAAAAGRPDVQNGFALYVEVPRAERNDDIHGVIA